jgi:signal transduction histidine kinase
VRTRSLVVDAVLAAAVLAAVQLEAWQGNTLATHREGPHWAQAAGYGIAAAALALRRLRPLLCVLLVCGALVVEFAAFGAPEGFGVFVPPLIAAYSVAAHEDRRRSLVGLAAVVALGLAWNLLDPVNVTPIQHLQGLAWITPWIAAWLLGAYLRTRRLYVQGLVREREERAQTAVAEERTRIARELHDAIGHSVSVMTVHASAVRRLMRPDQERERAALETVEATGREALAEMRRMVSVLRSPDAAPDLAPPPTLDQLDRLLETVAAAGLAVDLHTEGEVVTLPPGLDLTAYRLVQEGLTNSLKHASATRAVVRLHYGEDALLVTVRDDGCGPDPSSSSGTGLLGLAERVAVYGGTLTAGPAVGGGFELRAELPLGTP